MGGSKGSQNNAYVPKVEPSLQQQVKQEAPKVLTQDDKLIEEYTAKIAANQLEGGEVYYKRGLAYIRTKQYRAAIQDFDAAMRIVPHAPLLYYNRAVANVELEVYDAAVADLTEAIKLKPDFVDAYNTRGLAYIELQDFNSALADFNKAISLNENLSEAYYNLGTLYVRMKDFKAAKDAFSQAINKSTAPANATPEQLADLQTKLMQAYLSLARVQSDLGEFEEALKDATYVVDNDPSNIDALRIRAEIYEKLGNSAAAANDTATADSKSLQNLMDSKQ